MALTQGDIAFISFNTDENGWCMGIFTNNRAELIAVVENGLNRNTNLATDARFIFV